jgi:hypothetical protein
MRHNRENAISPISFVTFTKGPVGALLIDSSRILSTTRGLLASIEINNYFCAPMYRICDNLARIWILGSVHLIMVPEDTDPAPVPALFVSDYKMPTKNKLFLFVYYYFL